MPRIVLPSPNDSSIAKDHLPGLGVQVILGCLRNREAVARYVDEELGSGRVRSVAIVAAGERRDDDSLRPALEDKLASSVVPLLENESFSPAARRLGHRGSMRTDPGSGPPDVTHTDHWRVAHEFNSTLPGWLPTRHIA